jgi:hypothetical protein
MVLHELMWWHLNVLRTLVDDYFQRTKNEAYVAGQTVTAQKDIAAGDVSMNWLGHFAVFKAAGPCLLIFDWNLISP